MSKSRTAVMAAALLLCAADLGACTTGTAPSAPTAPNPGQAAANGVTLVTAACQAAEPVVDAVPAALPNASASTKATVDNILTYYQAACSSAQAIDAVVAADPSGGNSTVTWVKGLAAGIVAALPTVGTLVH